MTVQEAYINGFCKTAEAYGVDPGGLYKYAKSRMNDDAKGATGLQKLIAELSTNEDLHRAALGAALTGGTAAVTSDSGSKLRNGVLAALLGGGATYGVSRAGMLDNLPNSVRRMLRNYIKANSLADSAIYNNIDSALGSMGTSRDKIKNEIKNSNIAKIL